MESPPRPCNVNVGNANANNGLFNFNANNDWSNANGVRIYSSVDSTDNNEIIHNIYIYIDLCQGSILPRIYGSKNYLEWVF